MKLGEIAAISGLGLKGDGGVAVNKVASIEEASDDEIACVKDSRAAMLMERSGAGALIVPENIEPDRPALVAENPMYAMAVVLEILNPPKKYPPGIHELAITGTGVSIDQSAHIGPYVTVGDRARIGKGAVILSGAKVGSDCVVGNGSIIFENVVLYDRTRVGSRCVIHANSSIGADGFGYVPLETGEFYKIPQVGYVDIGDDVEIGANSTIDRATLGATRIGKGVKIDDHVHVGHNCVVGENCIIAGCTGLAGSVVMEPNVMVGGMVAISDHVKIASGAMIAGMTGVHTSITEPGKYAGSRVMKIREFNRLVLSGKRIDKLEKKIRELGKKNTSETKKD